ncbi:MAG: sodium:proton antiporter [Desulfobulbus sp.]|nr:sodium:proton antiporter [Desulfobulbus sp.]
MLIFEITIALLAGSTILSILARRLGIPYPAILALGGVFIALFSVQGAPNINLSPELILTLFVAPVLVDAAHDISLRDLRSEWRPISSLVLIAVGLTTISVAFTTRYLFPEIPWAAAITLGALLAPPDAVAAMAVLRYVKLPSRVRIVLEGESLLNDASALLLYKLAVGAMVAGHFSAIEALPVFALVVFGSVVVGLLLAKLTGTLAGYITDAPTSVIFQFVLTFGVWLVAEQLHLSGVVTIVVFGISMSRYTTLQMPARLRISTFAIWESATFVLNVLAFSLIGLQVRPIIGSLDNIEVFHLLTKSLIILGVVIAIRIVWVMLYSFIPWKSMSRNTPNSQPPHPAKAGIVIAWSGMRGIVTLAAAMALPENFPFRDFIQLTAFVVVLGTLVIQGPTLRPLLALLRLPTDDIVGSEIHRTRTAALQAAIAELEKEPSATAQSMKLEYQNALALTCKDEDPHNTEENLIRRKVAIAARRAILNLHRTGEIGDDAYRHVEEELDWFELSAGSQYRT